ncbi:MAG: hypothetical protein HZC48_13340 [Nitrospirae bacterium]|nr:hypothetical protein [Nitrospirota bacterium]
MQSKVVARFKDGSIIKGITNDFSPLKKHFHLELMDNQVIDVKVDNLKTLEIDLTELKGAFFVKDFEGNKSYDEEYGDVVIGAGRKVQVTFEDGEVIIGFALSYSPDRLGFFLVPADKKSNNERIYVINASTRKVEFL